MNKRQEAKLAMLRLVLFVLGKYGAVYAAASGLVSAVEALQEVFDGITGQNQQAEDGRNSGGAAARKQATKELGHLAYSISASVRSCASANGDRSLVDRMSYSRWEITRGRASSIIARCQGILTAASGLAKQLTDYAVSAADLKALEQKISAFEAAYIKPRHGTVSGAAARMELPVLFTSAGSMLAERIDGMVFKFKDKSPEFVNEYTAARVTVSLPTSANEPAAGESNVVPGPNASANTLSGVTPAAPASSTSTPSADKKVA